MTEVTTTQVGHVVPDFEMETYLPSKKDFGKFSLAEAKKAGKWTVLVFYPADFTFVCATEFQALAEQYETLQKLGAEVLTVSTDTKFTHLAWQRHEGELSGVTYPMAADPTGKVAKMFGVYMAEAGLALRGTFIIGPDGALAYQGAVDSTASANVADIATATNYVRDALGSLAAGQPVSVKSTRPYGCSVKYG